MCVYILFIYVAFKQSFFFETRKKETENKSMSM